jgi:peptide/nickel transport system substrate-binding protein
LSDFGAEGGVYSSPYGEWVADEMGTRLSLKLKDAGRSTSTPTAEYLSRYLLNMADPTQPQYQPDFAALVAGVTTAGSEWVHLDWSRPFVRPEALLQVPIFKPSTTGDTATPSQSPYGARFAMVDSEPGSTAFNAVSTDSNARHWMRTLVEQSYPNDDAAIAALLHGEVDVIDRVPPWQIERLRKAKGIHVDSYRLPTVHVLIPNPAHPLPAQRELRRAICYGIQRDRIIQQVMLGGGSLPGYQVVSGPFPLGLSFSDPLRYAYNNQLEPRPFEPRLAAVLATVAWSRVLDPKGKGNVELAEPPTLVLAHPADPVARIACETIRLQLGRAGIPIELVEFTSDDLLNGHVEYDLRYAELAVWEPVVDARTLLGPKGLAGNIGGPYLYGALRQLDEATTWKDVRSRLSEIHDIVYHDLPVIPLWQTVNYFAYRSSVRGISASPITLYQDVDKWEIEGANAPDAAPSKP